MNSTWSLGTAVGFPILVLSIIALIGGGVWLIRRGRSVDDDFDRKSVIGLGAGLLVTALAFVVGTGIGMYPYSAEYHQWREDTGTVTSIDSRFTSATQRVVVTLDDDRQRSCDDTRCAEVQVGDELTLSCKRHWQYTGTDGYDCNFVGRTR